jgi:hypothetical protein
MNVVPEAGLGQVGALSAISKAHPQCLHHQRHAASKLSNIPMLRHFRRFVKPRYYAPTNHSLLTNYSAKTRSLALSLAPTTSQIAGFTGVISAALASARG